VPGGTYFRTYNPSNGSQLSFTLAADSGPTGEAAPATLSGFRLDKYLVTVGRFRQFVNAWKGGSGWKPSAGSGKHTHLNGGNGLSTTAGGYEPGWVASDDTRLAPSSANLACDPSYATWTAPVGNNESLPINCVNWYEAYAFCIWDDGFLPSEAEWGYAAAGGNRQREYPWGSTDPATSNQYAIYDCNYPCGAGTCDGTVADIAPVGTATLGAGLWGQLDLAGEVSEWNLDWYAASYLDPCTDCAYLTAASFRVTRGGPFVDENTSILPPPRDAEDPTRRNSTIGLRCARTP
jgi:formylglycine-generating enzyme required for sulfatase activity